MKRLFRILHWKSRARYWHRKHDAQKREVARLQLALLAEKYRNQNREDSFVSASIMGSRGMWGVAPRSGPALQEPSQPIPQIAQPDPFSQLPWPDKAEFETEWWPLAETRGLTKQQAQRDFMAELNSRRQLNDEPFMQ